MNQVTIRGITYQVESVITREDCLEQYPHTYANMVQQRQVRLLALRRPNGRKQTIAIQSEDGSYSFI